MNEAVGNLRYEHWHRSASGRLALLAQETLVRRMISGWPRRGRKLLELFCGSGHFLEFFWQAGFDVTGQDREAKLLERARIRLKQTADFTLGHPEHLPYDDGMFDYVVCLNGLEFCDRPPALLAEMSRLASVGILLGFPSAWSWHGLGKALCPDRKSPGFQRAFSPRQVRRWLREIDQESPLRWAANLAGPACTWAKPGLLRQLNLISIPLPMGAFSLVRLNLAPGLAGTPLPLKTVRPALAPCGSAGSGQ